LTDGRVRLQWTVAGPGDPQQTPAAGCAVYKAQRPLGDTDCIDCRLAFQKIADVAVLKEAVEPGGRRRLDFSDDPAPGFEYAYRVICSTAAGVPGNESNVVRFELPEPTTQQP
jgi:hypothetical protein